MSATRTAALLFGLLSCALPCAAQPTDRAATGKPAPASGACPEPADMTVLHLYGLWRAQLEQAKAATLTTAASEAAASAPAQATTPATIPPEPATAPIAATLRLERHPELADSVRGRVEREGASAQLAGDVDDGDLTLEESEDGQRISATWTGRVVAGSCGKEIRGTWTRAADNSTRTFVLRRQPGWQ